MNNHRKTPERYAILKAVYSIDGHFTLDELGAKLKEEYRFLVSRATLYNTINLFMELRLVIRHRFQGSTKYEACYADNSHCHQICTVCGRVTEVKSPEIAEAIEKMHLKRFRKDGFTLYIYGICSTCQAAITRKNKKHKQ
jgi:Fur family ferric uptake transcriptional regulator